MIFYLQTQKSVSSSTTAVMYYCFDMSGIECTSHAQNNSGTIVSNECCHTDMCNDDRRKYFEKKPQAQRFERGVWG